jgi:hypothetical protein
MSPKPYLLVVDPLLQGHSLLLHLVVLAPHFRQVVVRRVVLPFVGLEGLYSQLLEVVPCEEADVCVSEWGRDYFTPCVTELRAASLKD